MAGKNNLFWFRYENYVYTFISIIRLHWFINEFLAHFSRDLMEKGEENMKKMTLI